MPTAVDTDLWRVSLGRECSANDAESFRQRLLAAHVSVADRASTLAGEISRDLPEFTVHDASHSDALWDLADRIAGSHLTLNPVEAFVFGAAVLVHDLGMASAAYVSGPDALREEPRWSDTVASVLRQKSGAIPRKEEITDPEEWAVDKATERILRDLHAQYAEELATGTWTDRKENQYALLEDPDLRETLGPIIGKIAHSHWWPVSVLGERFMGELGAPPKAPSDWTVRPLILACLLRLADASHLDGSRAPRFLRLLRAPKGEAKSHWTFQEHLSQPLLQEDRFVFTGSSFGPDEADAWWLCADTLSMVDREFRSVDSLLADRRQPRFAARGVTGGDDLTILAEHIPTDGWTPIDAKVRVSNVVRLVERLGGRELYGSKPEVPLRELIQNASDSVRARRVVDEQDEVTGKIVVSISDSDKKGWQWLEVLDTGLGMSREVLTNHLLDFGISFWESERVIEEFPGLLASGFEPVGRFGIGFFSVFMWGDDVDVISRRHDAARAATHVLEFRGGVAKRPLLRLASSAEQMKEPGTRVRILLDNETIWRLGFNPGESRAPILQRLCGWLAPALDVDLEVEGDGVRAIAVKAGDWIAMPFDELATRINDSPLRHSADYPSTDDEDEPVVEEVAEEHPSEVELREEEAQLKEMGERLNARALLLKDDADCVIGRLAINDEFPGRGVTVVGGLRATPLSYVMGVLFSRPTTASRNAGVPLVSAEQLAAWASDQAQLVGAGDSPDALEAAGVVWTCGGDPGNLPIVRTAEGTLSLGQLERWAGERDEIRIIHDAALHNEQRVRGEVKLGQDVVSTSSSPSHLVISGFVGVELGGSVDFWPLSLRGNWMETMLPSSPYGALARAVSSAWGIEAREIIDSYGTSDTQAIGQRGDDVVELEATVLRRNPGSD